VCAHLCIHVLLCSSSPHNHTTLHFTARTPSGCDDRVISLCLRLRVERDDPQSATNPQRRCFARGLRSAVHLGGGPGTLYDPIPLGDDHPIKPCLTLARTSWRCYGGAKIFRFDEIPTSNKQQVRAMISRVRQNSRNQATKDLDPFITGFLELWSFSGNLPLCSTFRFFPQ